MQEGEILKLVIAQDQHKIRLDKALALLCEDFSRARLQDLIASGQVTVNGDDDISASLKVQSGDQVTVTIPPPVPAAPQPEDIPINVVFEDDHLLVINKPAGLVVHPGAGNHAGTLVNALLAHCAGSLSGIGGVERPGIVHRLDKDTSGLMVVAKHDKAHQGLAVQLQDRSLTREYAALVLGVPVPRKGVVDQPIMRHRVNRQKMTVARRHGGRDARTHYHVQETWGEAGALVTCKLETGRTHQIRVHMAFLGYPLLGDPLYGPQPTAVGAKFKKYGLSDADLERILSLKRQMLHAQKIEFIHPLSQEYLSFSAGYPEDFKNILTLLTG